MLTSKLSNREKLNATIRSYSKNWSRFPLAKNHPLISAPTPQVSERANPLQILNSKPKVYIGMRARQSLSVLREKTKKLQRRSSVWSPTSIKKCSKRTTKRTKTWRITWRGSGKRECRFIRDAQAPFHQLKVRGTAQLPSQCQWKQRRTTKRRTQTCPKSKWKATQLLSKP